MEKSNFNLPTPQMLIKKAKEAGKTRIALTCSENLITFYQAHGLQYNGISRSVIGDEVSYDMSIDLN